MIVGLWHRGSGLGDQLFCYLAARSTADRLRVPFGMVGEFKGKAFMGLYKGIEIPFPFSLEEPAGKIVVHAPLNMYEGKDWYDPEFNFIEDDTIVDGCRCQDERYFDMEQISKWVVTKPLGVLDSTCVINFRGGEFTQIPELFLPQSYWDLAIAKMKVRGYTNFEVHTDDPATAKKFFPEFKVIHDVDVNWRSVRYANGAIIGNSAFNILPRLLAHYDDELPDEDVTTIAPHFWARRNTKTWSTPQNYYKQFIYV